jgi:O-methyltransferase
MKPINATASAGLKSAQMKGTLRRLIVRCLQTTGLNAIASEYYYRFLDGFKSASTGLDEGFEAIFERAQHLGSFDDDAVYCEFGVFKGYSFWKAQHLAKSRGISGTRFFGFDSFEGLPEVSGIDQTAHGEFRQGQYKCSLETVHKNLDKAGVDWSKSHLIKGYFNETLKPDLARKHNIGTVGVAMIDCDLYESTVDVLRFLRGKLREGSILIMDDWNCFNGDDNRGQRRALREFLADEPVLRIEPFVNYGANSEAFIVREVKS